jgi:hypothetical protein
VAEVVGASSPRKWDEQKAYAQSGATVKYTGLGLARFSVQLRLYSAQDWADWDAFRHTVAKPPAGTKPLALSIEHPHLEDLEIRAVVVEELMQPEQIDDGEWLIEIRFIEWREPKKALATPKGAKASPAQKPDPVEAKIDALTKQFQELAAQ